MDEGHIARIVREAGVPDLVEVLAERLAPSDLQSLLLEVFRLRTEALQPADVLRLYETEELLLPAPVDPAALLELDRRAFSLLPGPWERVELSPVAPLGTCSALGGLSQNRIVSALRGLEVVADSTNVLALEAARRRRAERERPVRLCASHRLLRGQRFDPPHRQHFRLFGLVAADRAGNEDDMLGEHLDFYARLLDGVANVEVSVRPAEDDYYVRTRFQVHAADRDGERVQLVDGGFTDWTQRLLSDRKERLLISGVGSELLCRLI